jgi:tRNA pseudouridine55 synthase
MKVDSNKQQGLNGFLIINKPQGISSAKAVAIVKRSLSIKKIGHAGTLDPLACGVLPLALNEATKAVSYIMAHEKSYGFTIQWGENRDTLDAEGKVTEVSDVRPQESEILKILPNFIGKIEQMPPDFSALKVKGVRAYKLAREGKEVVLQPRMIDIFELKLTAADSESASFLVRCGKGTYVRSLARDIADLLGACGYVSCLERLSVGDFTKEESLSLEDCADIEKVKKSLININDALVEMPNYELSNAEVEKLYFGQVLEVSDLSFLESDVIKLRSGDKVVAFGKYSCKSIRAIRVFNYK